MQVTVTVFGELRRYLADSDTIQVEVPEEATVADVLAHLGVPADQVWMSAVNDLVVEADHPLTDGDRLEVFHPVGGGQEAERP